MSNGVVFYMYCHQCVNYSVRSDILTGEFDISADDFFLNILWYIQWWHSSMYLHRYMKLVKDLNDTGWNNTYTRKHCVSSYFFRPREINQPTFSRQDTDSKGAFLYLCSVTQIQTQKLPRQTLISKCFLLNKIFYKPDLISYHTHQSLLHN